MSTATSDDTLSAEIYGPISADDTSKEPAGMNLLRAILDSPESLPTRMRELHDAMRTTFGQYVLLNFLEAEVERLQRIIVEEMTETPRDDAPLVADYLRGLRRNGFADRKSDGDE